MKFECPTGPEGLYHNLVVELKQQGVLCAITGGLACVQYGVTHFTEDCDLICEPDNAAKLFSLLLHTKYEGASCAYRGLTAPLDKRWLIGGYTAHFHWPCKKVDKPFLDVFGVPPRLSSAWQEQMEAHFAGPHTVAEMKRTKRRKDWDQATALGLKMLKAGDSRGWFHIFDATVMQAMIAQFRPSTNELSTRPILRLALENNPLLVRGIQTEIDFWSHLDRIRLKVYEDASKLYARTIHKNLKSCAVDLTQQHIILVKWAEDLLPQSPIQDYGWTKIIKEAKDVTAIGLDPQLLDYLPDVSIHFANIVSNAKTQTK